MVLSEDQIRGDLGGFNHRSIGSSFVVLVANEVSNLVMIEINFFFIYLFTRVHVKTVKINRVTLSFLAGDKIYASTKLLSLV
jgi:hypothetical protein